MNTNNCLVLSPHPDDMELCCGGTIGRFKNVLNVAFSNCGIGGELMEASKFLGIEYRLLDFHVRHFSEYRQKILQYLIDLKFKPDIVFLPSSFDGHQDHQVIHNEGKRAFKDCNLLGYESCWNNYQFRCDTYSAMTEQDLQRKLTALEFYKSQQNKKYFHPEYTTARARIRGAQINKEFAEGFETIKWIL